MISPVFLNASVELFVENESRGAGGENVKTLTPLSTVRGCCDLKAVKRDQGLSMFQSVYSAKVFIDGPINLSNKHWARVTPDIGDTVILGQVTDCRHAGLCGDNVEFVVETASPAPPIVEGD